MTTLSPFQKKAIIAITVPLAALVVGSFFIDFSLGVALYVALLMVFGLSALMFLALHKFGAYDGALLKLFLITFLFHLAVALSLYYVIYHTPVRPLGGGSDFDLYQNNAMVFAGRLKMGDFSTKGLYAEHYFAIIMGIVYFLTFSHPVVGHVVAAFLAALTALLVYALVGEIGGSKKWGFFLALLTSAYPSYLFFGSVLLKEIFVIPLILLGLLLLVKILKEFSAAAFAAFFLVTAAIIHFRFYVGLAILYAFIVSWFVLSNTKMADRVILGFAMVFILGFAPALMGHGYLGEKPINYWLVPKQIKDLREVTYAPVSESFVPPPQAPAADAPVGESSSVDFFREREKANTERTTLEGRPLTPEEIVKTSGTNSSFELESGVDNPLTFVKNYVLSFVYASMGPFPWQIKLKRQLISFAEVIPWWFFLGAIAYGAAATVRKAGWAGFAQRYRYALPLVLFAVLAVGAISLFINNFGIIVRIRIPAVIALLCVLPLGPALFPKLARRFGKTANKKTAA